MPRYLPPDTTPAAETLPLDTIVTVLPRQSKRAGARVNVHSQELADHELIALATAHGYAPEQVRIDKRDMGISANTTTINERPALSNWLRNLLPAGLSKVVVFSQEDRAFRDEEEVELNLFIREVKRYRGWVICGHKVYRLWEEYDADMFRMECKYAAKYIVHQVRGRLLPSVTRAAQRGLYDGRGLNVGYVVDYHPKSPTYKRYIPYRPHADLVLHEMFERFAKLPYPSVPALVRAWNASNGMVPVFDDVVGRMREIPTLYFPLLPPDLDPRVMQRQSWGRPRTYPPYGIDDPLRRGWLLREQGARRILSNVFYIGWLARDGQIVRGETLENGQVLVDPKGSPLVLHEPIVPDLDLFWYCFERVSPYTIDGQPNPKRRFYSKGPRQKYNQDAELLVLRPPSRAIRNAESNTLLLLGKVRCGIHRYPLIRFRRRSHEPDYYICKHYDDALGHRQNYCMYLPGKDVDHAIVQEFLARLRLSEADVQGLARAWQAQQRLSRVAPFPSQGMTRAQTIEGELANLAIGVARTSVEAVRERLVAEMEKLTAELERIRTQAYERQEAEAQVQTEPLSLSALQVAQKSAKALETLRLKWDQASLASRQALMQWVVDSVTLTPVPEDRKGLTGGIIWRGGTESRLQMVRSHVRRQEWDAREREVMRLWYATGQLEDLRALLPGRSRDAMTMQAHRMGIGDRSFRPSNWRLIPPEEMARLAPPPKSSTTSSAPKSDTQTDSAPLGGSILLEIAHTMNWGSG